MVNTVAKLTALIALLDERMNIMLNEVIHHADFQSLERSWRSVHRLLSDRQERSAHLKILCLPLSYAELKQDLLTAIDFEQSYIFQKIYNFAFDMPGGEPMGLWIGDYQFAINDRMAVALLKQISDIAAASFCPFISAVSLTSLGIQDISSWYRLQNFDFLMHAEFKEWQKLRLYTHARFIYLLLPALLLRQPYQKPPGLPFGFYEQCTDTIAYLWGNPAYALAIVVSQAFSRFGWFDFIQGEPFAGRNAGLVKDWQGVEHTNHSEFRQLNAQIYVTEEQEAALNQQGFISLFSKQYDKALLFYYMPSIKKTALAIQKGTVVVLDDLLPYLLCVSRFTHYLKIICRGKIGSFKRPAELEDHLLSWIRQYCAGNEDLPLTSLGQYPLKEAKIQVSAEAGKSRCYRLRIELFPRVHLQGVEAKFVLFTDVAWKS